MLSDFVVGGGVVDSRLSLQRGVVISLVGELGGQRPLVSYMLPGGGSI